ncbi:MAG: hypothetical protein IPN29_20420 [Saprospiraceae bacterium]|nr:hypothetical protein [Saprospiraceae bacterium]
MGILQIKKLKQNVITIGLLFLLICSAHAQDNNWQLRLQEVMAPLMEEDWAKTEKLAHAYIKEAEKAKADEDLISIIRYVHIYAVAGLMNEGTLTQKEALKEIKKHKGHRLIMPDRIFQDNCIHNCLYVSSDDPAKIGVCTTNEDRSKIFAFEYYHLDKNLEDEFITEAEGKLLDLEARLKDIEVEGLDLPRFRLNFDEVKMSVTELPGNSSALDYPKGVFIEPNIQFAPDSRLFVIKNVNENHDEGTEVRLTFKMPNRKTGLVSLIFKDMDDTMDHAELIKNTDEFVSSYDEIPDKPEIIRLRPPEKFYTKNYAGFFILTKTKEGQEYNVSGLGAAHLEYTFVEVKYSSSGNEAITNFEDDKLMLSRLLDGLSLIDSADISEPWPDEMNMSITVDSIECDKYYPLASYCALVTVEDYYPLVIKDVTIGHNPSYVYEAEKGKNEIKVKCFNKEKGRVIEKGKIRFLSPVGKVIEFDFELTYTNL